MRNPKDKFYKKLKLDKRTFEVIKFFRHIKKEMINDCSKNESGK